MLPPIGRKIIEMIVKARELDALKLVKLSDAIRRF